METFDKLLDLYSEIGDIYIELCDREIRGLTSFDVYNNLVKSLKEKVTEEKKIFKELFNSSDFEKIKSIIFEEDNVLTMRLKDYIKNYEELNTEILDMNEEEIALYKEFSIKAKRLISACVKNLFLVYSSFSDDFIEMSDKLGLRERLLTIKYYNCFTKHDMEEVYLSYDFRVPHDVYCDVYIVADMLGFSINDCDEIVLEFYFGVMKEIIEQLMSLEDEDYKDYNKLSVVANASFMIQACLVLISEKDYLGIKDKIIEIVEEYSNKKIIRVLIWFMIFLIREKYINLGLEKYL